MAERRASRIGARRRNARKAPSDGYDERRARLIEAAAKVFRDKGFQGASINDVATEFGSDRATLYYYVSNKHELFEMVIADAVQANVKMAEEVRSSEADAATKLRTILVELMRSYDANYPHLFVYLQEDMLRLAGADAEWEARMLDWSRRYFQAVRDVIQQGIDEKLFTSSLPVTITAQGVVGMISWSHHWYKPSGSVSADQIGEGFADMVLRGLVR
ncbi:TetR/AcrR family transcriptional regulator [Saccharopolyspora spinosa]|uniref:TetR family transcriptional regulator n=1 Tax=Saccharopolyspora spinosa TaxID=60894 RepID=A0A2N3Y3H9_SACSN|nr:TetR/AcrR family transcriptional regulator [Saccharopolyspora spinosa]PKW17475.1 TetR family transcriptional regulator [Saccharopolyspora spinosa]